MKRAAWMFTASLLVACGPDDSFRRLDFTYASTPPGATEVSYEGVQIPAGQAVGVNVSAEDDDGPMASGTDIDLASTDPTVIGVARSLDAHGYVFFGVGPGQATITVHVAGRPERGFEARVTPQ